MNHSRGDPVMHDAEADGRVERARRARPFREEALRAATEGATCATLEERLPRFVKLAVHACAVLMLATPLLAWWAYTPMQSAEGTWLPLVSGHVRAHLSLPRHPRAEVEVGNRVTLSAEPSAARTFTGTVVEVRPQARRTPLEPRRVVVTVEIIAWRAGDSVPVAGSPVKARIALTPVSASSIVAALSRTGDAEEGP